MFKIIFKYLFATMFVFGGINHFISTDFYTGMMPVYLPAHEFLVYLSGVLEIIFGVGLLVQKFQKKAAWCIFALLIAVFPANMNMYLNAGQFADVSEIALLVRLFVQGLFLWGALWLTKAS
jgi:uncharacterized membrane protein